MAAVISISGSVTANGGRITVSWSGLKVTQYAAAFADNLEYIGPYTLQLRADGLHLAYADGSYADIYTQNESGTQTITLSAEDVAYNDERAGREIYAIYPSDSYTSENGRAEGSGQIYNDAWSAYGGYLTAAVSTQVVIERTSAVTEPTAPTLNQTLSREAVLLGWGAGGDGTGNSVTGYDVQYADSTNGTTWGSWQTASGSPVSGTQLNVSPPATPGYYRKFRVRTRGSAGSDYYSGWVESTNALRRKWDAFGAWEDPILTAGVSGIRAVHLTQLQERVNAIRAFYGLSGYGFTSVTARKTKISRWADLILEIRTAIDQIGIVHESWNTLSAGRPRIANITQLRRIIDEM